MPFDSVQISGSGGSWGAFSALVRSDGTASHAHALSLAAPDAPLRDVADALHLICLLHGDRPGLIDHATGPSAGTAAEDWVAAAVEGFPIERGYVIRLVAAAGPLPSTPGQAETDATIRAQRHALDMLGQSARLGCAAGAAMALAIDWRMIRGVLDAAAARLGIAAPEYGLPTLQETAIVIDALAYSLSIERAMMFGAQQLLAQHRGLWDLLEARASARDRQ